MVNQELLNYIKQQLELKTEKSKITGDLLQNGWNSKDIDEAFVILEGSPVPSPVPQAPLSNLSGASLIIKETFRILFKNFGAIIVFFSPAVIFGELLYTVYNKSGFSFSEDVSKVFATLGILTASSFILSLIISSWSTASFFYYLLKREEKITIFQAFSYGAKRTFPVLGVTLLLSLSVAGGTALLVVPGIILAIQSFFAIPICALENINGLNALLKSREYIRGFGSKVFKRFSLFSLVFFGIFILFGFFISLFQNKYLSALSETMGGILLSALTAIFSFLVYSELKKIKGENLPQNNRKGLIVVCAIIGVLVFVSTPIIVISTANKIRSDVNEDINAIKSELENTDIEIKTEGNDDARLTDLMWIRNELNWYFDDYNKYPESISEIAEKTDTVDPETGVPYQYESLDNGQDYQVCATLNDGSQRCITKDSSINDLF